jgi:hypothetical protein
MPRDTIEMPAWHYYTSHCGGNDVASVDARLGRDREKIRGRVLRMTC